MKRTLFPLTTAALLMGSVAIADTFTDSVVNNLKELGYEFIEVKRGPSQLKAEAVRGDRKLEVVYDLSTGKIIKQETESAGDYAGRTGVEIDVESSNFVDDNDDDDQSDDSRDDDDDDDKSGRSSSDDDDDDDNSGRDSSDDHDDDHDDDSDDDSDDDDHGDDSGHDDSDDDNDDDD